MEIVVLIKPVPEAETRLRPDRGGAELDPAGVKFVLAGYDESAVEQALLLKESAPGTTIRAVSLGPLARSEEVLRAALALGVDHATSVEEPPGVAHDPVQVARMLAFVVSRYSYSLLLGGKQSGDEGSGCVPSAVAEFLGVPDFGSVTDLKWDPIAGRFTFRQSLERTVLSVEAPPPVMIGLQQAWNDPRTAKLPMILRSRKAPIDRVPRAEVEALLARHPRPAVRAVSFRLPPPRMGARMIEYSSPQDAARKLVRLLTEEAKVL
ncbi:MAG: electron transfer flavoprotein subunit beta/FixA family protein [Thermoplasmata archaeon]|nr:electron transfer flavoprotein subunit beta/FixA family protein [Thermoplasmata archaeon]MCI4360004.1 electron transfer flavoprotein subunit beta/FixA family protein [Thermoplasmata archaeon]